MRNCSYPVKSWAVVPKQAAAWAWALRIPPKGFVSACATTTSTASSPLRFATWASSVPAGRDGFFGVCQPELFQRGQLCGTSDPNKFGQAFQCDTGPGARTPNQVCLQLSGLFDEGRGLCYSTCEAGQTCPSHIAGQAPGECVTDILAGSLGLCSESCTLFPESCPAVGGQDQLGFGCFELGRLFQIGGLELNICVDRKAPSLTRPARLDADGAVTDPGDNCFAPGGSPNYFSCPYPTYCEIVDFQAGEGLCIAGCAVGGPTDVCPQATMSTNSVCTDIFFDGSRGICTE